MLCHLSIFIGHFIPFGNIIAPLVIWQMKKGESDFVAHHGMEALNFQISLMILFIAAILLAFVGIGFILLIALWIFGLVIVVIAALRANDGVYYRYPFTIRLIK